jgi:hypothetical protein
MTGSDALTVTAEISIGLAGFTGIIVALLGRSDSWTQFDVVRSIHLLMLGFGAMLLSLLPFALSFFGLAETIIWRSCSGAYLASAIPFVVVQRRLGAGIDWQQVVVKGTVVPLVTLSIILFSLQIVNLWYAQLSLFFLGLVWYLVLGGFQFAAILFVRPRSAA